MSYDEFWSMGGYAFYVWTSFGVVFLVLLMNLVLPMLQKKKIIAELKRKARIAKRIAEKQEVAS